MSDMLVGEERRLAALRGYDVLDTEPEPDFDDIAVLAAQLCHAPAAAVSLIGADREFLKAIVDAHDGVLSIDSDTGCGATVTVRLARHDIE